MFSKKIRGGTLVLALFCALIVLTPPVSSADSTDKPLATAASVLTTTTAPILPSITMTSTATAAKAATTKTPATVKTTTTTKPSTTKTPTSKPSPTKSPVTTTTTKAAKETTKTPVTTKTNTQKTTKRTPTKTRMSTKAPTTTAPMTVLSSTGADPTWATQSETEPDFGDSQSGSGWQTLAIVIGVLLGLFCVERMYSSCKVVIKRRREGTAFTQIENEYGESHNLWDSDEEMNLGLATDSESADARL